MRCLNRKDFLAMPSGTIYCKGVRWSFYQLSVKFDSLASDDWIYLDFDSVEAHDSGELLERFEEMLASGMGFPINESAGRDGCFDRDAVFLVFEKDDLLKLRHLIDYAIKIAPSTPPLQSPK